MTLLEAMKSGRRFHVKSGTILLEMSALTGFVVYADDPKSMYHISQERLEMDYELEPLPEKKVEVTAEQIRAVSDRVLYSRDQSSLIPTLAEYREALIRGLGLE